MLAGIALLGTVWIVGGVALYWNLAGTGLLPSNHHVRVLAVLWPIAVLAGVGWLVVRGLDKMLEGGVNTVESVVVVSEWRYHQGRLLPRPRDPAQVEAEQEVERLLEGE